MIVYALQEHRKKEEKSSKRTLETADDADKGSSNKKQKTSDTDTPQRSSSREKKPASFYKDEIQSIDEPKPRKGSGSSSDKVEVYTDVKKALPTRNEKGELVFPDYPHFRPNLTPKEVLQKGSFGGTYFRPIYSRVTQQHYSDVWKVIDLLILPHIVANLPPLSSHYLLYFLINVSAVFVVIYSPSDVFLLYRRNYRQTG